MATRFETTELSVCQVCLFIIAYGEYDDGTNAGDRSAAGIERTWGKDARHLVAGGDELGFCRSRCDGCGDRDHGDRFTATALIPRKR